MVNYIKRDELRSMLQDATTGLLQLAKELCWNEISPNCIYHLSKAPNDGSESLSGKGILTRSTKEKLKLQTLDELMPVLNTLYPDLYDIKLFIRHAANDHTVIDLRYIIWDSDFGFRNTDGEPLPFINASIMMPPFHKEGTKVDINWKYDTLKHRIELFWWRGKFRVWYLFVIKFKLFRGSV